MFSSKKYIFLFLLIVIVLVIAGVFLGLYLSQGTSAATQLSPYSAVYLSTGDIYFGELSFAPWPRIKNPWFLQRTSDGENLNISPMAATFWGPSNVVNLNPKEIIFWTRLRADSQVASVMANPQAAQQQTQSGTNPTSNFAGPTSPPPVQ